MADPSAGRHQRTSSGVVLPPLPPRPLSDAAVALLRGTIAAHRRAPRTRSELRLMLDRAFREARELGWPPDRLTALVTRLWYAAQRAPAAVLGDRVLDPSLDTLLRACAEAYGARGSDDAARD